MHEESVIRDLVQKVDTVAREGGGRPVRTVRLWIGALSHVTERQLTDRWALAAHGTLGAGARLEVTRSSDATHPRALSVVLSSVDVEEP